jgi:hypothetical protein
MVREGGRARQSRSEAESAGDAAVMETMFAVASTQA